MKILIAGASGFIGRELVAALMSNHHMIVLGRDIDRLNQLFPSAVEKISWNQLEHYDPVGIEVIINLCGTNIGAARWTDAIKKELIASRTVTNHQLISWLVSHKLKPHYYCANAVGIYGAHEADQFEFDESTQVLADDTADFLRQIGVEWEKSLSAAIEYGLPVTTLRFGVVLKKGEGMLKKLEMPFSLGLGSVLGAGNQMLSWIHYQDLVSVVNFLLAHPDITGPVNITSPQPVTQKAFAKQFAQVLNRPCLLKTPSFVVRMMFGEMGEYLLLKGQKVMPSRLLQQRFEFAYPSLLDALRKEYN